MNVFFKIIIGLTLLIASSYISITIPGISLDIPFTLQSLMVFSIAAFLSPKEYLIIIVAYLFIGILSLPVFAGGTGGIQKLLGASGGFLYGFIPAGLFIATYFYSRDMVTWMGCINIMLQATMVLFFFGIIHLALIYDFERAIEYGFNPFWKMALVKSFLAAIIVFYAKRITNLSGR